MCTLHGILSQFPAHHNDIFFNRILMLSLHACTDSFLLLTDRGYKWSTFFTWWKEKNDFLREKNKTWCLSLVAVSSPLSSCFFRLLARSFFSFFSLPYSIFLYYVSSSPRLVFTSPRLCHFLFRQLCPPSLLFSRSLNLCVS